MTVYNARDYLPAGGKHDWTIHYVCDNASFKPHMCDAHTHGLDKYGGKELQFVLRLLPALVGEILNGVGAMVKSGVRLSDGDYITGFFENPEAAIRIFTAKDRSGKDINRLIVPDYNFLFPEESESKPYSLQLENPYLDDITVEVRQEEEE